MHTYVRRHESLPSDHSHHSILADSHDLCNVTMHPICTVLAYPVEVMLLGDPLVPALQFLLALFFNKLVTHT